MMFRLVFGFFFFLDCRRKEKRFEVKTIGKKIEICFFFSAIKMHLTWEKRISLSTASIYVALYSNQVLKSRRNLDQVPHSNDEPILSDFQLPCTHTHRHSMPLECQPCDHKFHRYIVKTSWFYYNVENWVIFHKRRWNELNNLSSHFQMVSTTNKIRRTLYTWKEWIKIENACVRAARI